jgi:hypothetical protein
VLDDAVLTQQYETTVLVSAGATYNFKVEARNSVGYSLLSDPVAILCAQPPDQPASPTVSSQDSNIIITWNAPYDGGTPILSYKILVLLDDGLTYLYEPNLCDGADPTIVSTRSCTIANELFT